MRYSHAWLRSCSARCLWPAQVIMDCDYEQRDELWKNVLLAGGTSFTKNLPERLQSELGDPPQEYIKSSFPIAYSPC